MEKNRLEAFSDGVLAIIITIMVLELHVPHADTFESLQPLVPVFMCYILSFIYVGIYWNNHHHLFQLVKKVNGPVLWANTHLLFWLSLIPFVTSWSGENHFAAAPVALYGVVLFMCATAYYILGRCLTGLHGKNSEVSKALGRDYKGKLSNVLYFVGIAISFWAPWVGLGLYALVAAIWFIPDRRVEKQISRA